MSKPVCPVTGEHLRLARAGRQLLDIDRISLGHAGCTGILGPNGAGKSLLLRILSGLMRADSGRVLWAGREPDADRRLRVGLLLQSPVLLRRTALDNLHYALQAAGQSRRQATLAASAALDEAGLRAVGQVPAHRLSGGERQRVALARALALNPDMLFLDEVTANVDPASTLVIEHQLSRAVQGGLQLVMISHDVAQVRRLAREVVLLHKGRVVEQSSAEHFFEHTNNPVSRRWLNGELLV